VPLVAASVSSSTSMVAAAVSNSTPAMPSPHGVGSHRVPPASPQLSAVSARMPNSNLRTSSASAAAGVQPSSPAVNARPSSQSVHQDLSRSTAHMANARPPCRSVSPEEVRTVPLRQAQMASAVLQGQVQKPVTAQSPVQLQGQAQLIAAARMMSPSQSPAYPKASPQSYGVLSQTMPPTLMQQAGLLSNRQQASGRFAVGAATPTPRSPQMAYSHPLMQR
jgi:hypothetical protein